MPTRDQTRARDAANLVAGEDVKADSKRYNSLAHKLPVLLRQNGLLQTAAFLKSKARGKNGETSEGRHYKHLSSQLVGAQYLPQGTDLIDFLVAAKHDVYLLSQEEAVACAGWHKRLSGALYGEPDTDGAPTAATPGAGE